MATTDVSSALRILLADTVTFSFQALGCHWNVTGPDFSQYHDLFGNVYDDVSASIDPLAESIRKLGEHTPFNLSRFVELRTIKFRDTKTDAKSMVEYLLEANDAVLKSISKAFAAANKADEQGIANLLAERDDMHKKWRWQLQASKQD